MLRSVKLSSSRQIERFERKIGSLMALDSGGGGINSGQLVRKLSIRGFLEGYEELDRLVSILLALPQLDSFSLIDVTMTRGLTNCLLQVAGSRLTSLSIQSSYASCHKGVLTRINLFKNLRVLNRD
jgi:hypothetical protein